MLSASRESKVRKRDYLMPILISYLPLFSLLKKEIWFLLCQVPEQCEKGEIFLWLFFSFPHHLYLSDHNDPRCSLIMKRPKCGLILTGLLHTQRLTPVLRDSCPPGAPDTHHSMEHPVSTFTFRTTSLLSDSFEQEREICVGVWSFPFRLKCFWLLAKL